MLGRWFLLTIVSWCSVAAMAMAGETPKFDRSFFDTLAPMTGKETIPVGTKITAENWQRYKQFMPYGMQAFFSGSYFWRMEPEADHYIEIGPPTLTPIPSKFREDTEKYHGQAKLLPSPNGGYRIEGYVAGLPFPEHTGPNRGVKELYNLFYMYVPPVFYQEYYTMPVDRYFNRTTGYGLELFYRLGSISEPGMPIDNPAAPGYYLSLRNQVLQPEQTKYTTVITLFHKDPDIPQEAYVFVPSLRRALRLSSSARCSPLLGTDWIEDDNRGFNGLPSFFKVEFLGERKLLTSMNQDRLKKTEQSNYFTGRSLGWPKPVIGPFELRDAYVIDVVPSPAITATYCVSHRVIYIDRELEEQIEYDQWDREAKFWKSSFSWRGPVPVTGEPGIPGSMVVPSGDENAVMYDFQDDHASAAWQGTVAKVNKDVPATYHDVVTWALPGGLAQIMK